MKNVCIVLLSILMFAACEKVEKTEIPLSIAGNELKGLSVEQLAPHQLKLSWEKPDWKHDGFLLLVESDQVNFEYKQIRIEEPVTEYLYEIIPGDKENYQIKIMSFLGDQVSKESVLKIETQFESPKEIEVQRFEQKKNKISWKYEALEGMRFQIDFSDDQTNWSELASIEVGKEEQKQFFFIDSKVPEGGQCFYRVYVWFKEAKSPEAKTNIYGRLLTPTKFTARSTSTKNILLSWEQGKDISTGFVIDKKLDDENWQEEIASLGSGERTYLDENAPSGHTYSYRIRSKNDTEESENSEVQIHREQAKLQTAYPKNALNYIPRQIQFNFGQEVRILDGQKNFKIFKSSDDTEVSSIPVSKLSIAGSVVWTEIPLVLEYNTDYYCTLDEGAFDDTQYDPTQSITKESNFSFRTPAFKDTEFVLVEAGSFMMGEDKSGWSSEKDHEVELSTFHISKYEVTTTEYCQFLNEKRVGKDLMLDGHKLVGNVGYTANILYHNGAFYPKAGNENKPIIHVTWYGADAYCKFRGGRLPSEAEWEFAAKGGNASLGLKYPNSNDVNEVSWNQNNSGRYLREIGGRKANELGIHDMLGNASEWCNDWYDGEYYKTSPKQNPQGPTSGTRKVLRGGSYYTGEVLVNVCNRMYDEPNYESGIWNGFRMAK